MKHRIVIPRSKLRIPKMDKVTANDTIAYVGQFDRLNGLKPIPFIFRNTYNTGR